MEEVIITVEMTKDEAYAYAQFLKRVCLSDYQIRAVDKDEAYEMMVAGEKIRRALAEKGFAPR
jgi:hypothetical protein